MKKYVSVYFMQNILAKVKMNVDLETNKFKTQFAFTLTGHYLPMSVTFFFKKMDHVKFVNNYLKVFYVK